MRARVDDLQAKLDAQDRREAANAQRHDSTEQAAAADAVQRDAQRRSLDMEEPFTAGYVRDRGVIIRSDDGDFLLHPWAFIQIRNATNYRDSVAETGSTRTRTDTENGFELPRANLFWMVMFSLAI